MQFFLIVFIAAVVAGVVGSLLGLGGGVILVPFLTVFLGVPPLFAIGASIVSVIATSSGAASAYVRDGITNLRVGMFLEIGTTLGAVTGAYVAGLVSGRVLYVVFAVVLGYSALRMFAGRTQGEGHHDVPPDALADRL
ncbi:MAG: sulfite exporter TauE/SafE family protein, partial [Nitrososphaerota archaeon]|nr:sulfite exporter TauE/SafE family protein [Nitrososphaerota archaeon]